MKKFTKIIAVLFCFLLPTGFSAASDEAKLKPVFTEMTPDKMNGFINFVSEDKTINMPEEIRKHGYSIVLGMVSFTETAKNKDSYGFNQLPAECRETPLGYARCWVKYNRIPSDLTPEKFFEILGKRKLYHLTPEFMLTLASNEGVSVARTATIVPSAKPERDPAELFAERFVENQARVRRQEAELARLRATNKNNTTQLQRITELEDELKSLRSLMENLNQEQKLLTDTGRLNSEALKNQQNLLDNLSKEFEREVDGFKQDLLNLQKNQFETNNRVDGFSDMVSGITTSFGDLEKIVWGSVAVCIVLIGIMWRSDIFMRRQFASVNGRVDDLEQQIDDLEERVDEEIVDLSGLVIHDEHLLSKENINSLSYDKDSDTNSVSVLVTKPFGSDTAEVTVTVTRINKNQLKVNIPRNAGEKRERIVDINTRSLVRMIKKADKQDLLFPVRLKFAV